MSHTMIMRDRSIPLSDAEHSAARKVLQQGLRGVDGKHHARWLRFLRDVFALEDGEVAQVGTRIPRNAAFHRRHMALEQAVFDAQQRFGEFEQFRNWLKIGAGHVNWVPGAKGGIVPLPKSLSYAELDEAAMQQVHAAIAGFLRGPHAARYLWKQLDAAQAAARMEAIFEVVAQQTLQAQEDQQQ
ncbi:DUF1367 family protein [Undibacterium terreum]|uniref:Uncharacterized protein n=1 Tax=Undibacterium terreum TaxID=1224302 RepID=A0A916UA80_9BURK|nr:DUF1367 family protein [Undibacterium terreum]GGC65583.1 hypothetical protein GCM10011396_10740 [Undibacterium terreum]